MITPFFGRRSRFVSVAITAVSLLVTLPVLRLESVMSLRSMHPRTTALMEIRASQRSEVPRYVWVEYETIPVDLRRAVVAGEDLYYLGHRGIDYGAVRYALFFNLKQHRILRGGSTISQQLAKNLFLSEERTPLRKIKEAILATEIELLLDKRRILELYLNVIEWGNGVFGCEAAANHYFTKRVRDLSEDEALTLAAIIPNATRCDPLTQCASVIEGRVHRIRSLLHHPMLQQEFFSDVTFQDTKDVKD